MLNAADNELLCHVGPGTPMGQFLRRFWIPVLHCSQLPGPDCDPVTVRVLGEDLVAFRDSVGRIGVLQARCPHRLAPLRYGRNEESGLRCIYHGWKFDVEGTCLDMPSEPREFNFADKVRATAYPTLESQGMVWAYMGPAHLRPSLPDLEWLRIPESHCYTVKYNQECNFVQAIEGDIDSSHIGYLHMNDLDLWKNPDAVNPTHGGVRTTFTAPRWLVEPTDYGLMLAARRDAEPPSPQPSPRGSGEGSYYWRITQFLMPFFQMIPPYGASPTIGGHAWVPIDDEHTMTWSITWHPTRPLTEKELERMRAYPTGGIHVGDEGLLPATTQPWGRWMPRANASNDYELDHEAQKGALFSGILNLALQDSGMQESMGPIYNRTQEHLGASDTGIIQMRRRLINAAIALRERGVTPTGVDTPAAYRVRSAGVVLPRKAMWVEAAQDHLVARPGIHLASA